LYLSGFGHYYLSTCFGAGPGKQPVYLFMLALLSNVSYSDRMRVRGPMVTLGFVLGLGFNVGDMKMPDSMQDADTSRLEIVYWSALRTPT
jgi:hypothetical protein